MPDRPWTRAAPTLIVVVVAVLLMASPAAGHAVAVDPALLPAWQALTTVRDREGRDVGESYAAIAEVTQVRIVVGPPLRGSLASYEWPANVITVSPDILGEDPRAVAAILAHELTHALQASARLDRSMDCVAREVDAYLTEVYVWDTLWGGNPPTRTRLEERLTARSDILANEGEAGLVRFVTESPRYRDQCELDGA